MLDVSASDVRLPDPETAGLSYTVFKTEEFLFCWQLIDFVKKKQKKKTNFFRHH